MGTRKLLIIRVEELLFHNKKWDPAHINEHRQLLNLWIDNAYDICLVSTMDVSKLQEIQKNFYIAESGYLIGCDGGQIYNLSNKKELRSECFKVKELPLIERLVERVDFDNLNQGLISFSKASNAKIYFNNGSELFRRIQSECLDKNLIMTETMNFPKEDSDITKITIKFSTKINVPNTLALLKRLAPEFNYISNEENTIVILPTSSTLKQSFDFICSKDKEFQEMIANKEVITIGYTYSDLYLFDLSKLSYTLVSCPYEIASKANKTYMGEVSSLISFTLKEILKTE